jgi:hypothetical protein
LGFHSPALQLCEILGDGYACALKSAQNQADAKTAKTDLARHSIPDSGRSTAGNRAFPRSKKGAGAP